MRSRWRKLDGRLVKSVHQSEAEVAQILRANAAIRDLAQAKTGGHGSETFRYVGRVAAAKNAEWIHEWRQRGGYSGTGMTAQKYCILQMSKPENKAFVVTPSGNTGFEKEARRMQFGHTAPGSAAALGNRPPAKKHNQVHIMHPSGNREMSMTELVERVQQNMRRVRSVGVK